MGRKRIATLLALGASTAMAYAAEPVVFYRATPQTVSTLPPVPTTPSGGQSTTAPLSIVVQKPTADVAYGDTFTVGFAAQGGAGASKWNLVPTAPAGFASVSDAGSATYTATRPDGTYGPFSATLTDGTTTVSTGSFSVKVLPSAQAVALAGPAAGASSLTVATGGQISVPFVATGGRGPYTFGKTTVPTTLSANAAIGSNGILTGTAGSPGTYVATVTTTDVVGRTASASATVVVEAEKGDLVAWGYNYQRQLGFGTNGSTTGIPTPAAADLPAGVASYSSVVAGGHMSCGHGSNGKSYCWGNNPNYAAGVGSTSQALYVPTLVSGPPGNTAMAMRTTSIGGYNSCQTGSDGASYCSGYSNFGLLANASYTGDQTRPVPPTYQPTAGTTLSNVRSGFQYSCANGSDGVGYCWGSNNTGGRLGVGDVADRTVPTPVRAADGTEMADFRPQFATTCATGSDGALYCWGINAQGQIGDGTTVAKSVPTKVSLPNGVTKLSNPVMGRNHTCATGDDARTYCWGWNLYGQLGMGDKTNRLVPTPLKVGSVEFASVALGEEHGCGVGKDGIGYCWGNNQYGQLGTGDFTARTTPTPVVLAGGFKSYFGFAAGNYHTLAFGRK